MPRVSLLPIVLEVDRAIASVEGLTGIDESDRASALASLSDLRDAITDLCELTDSSPHFQMNLASESQS